MELKGVLGVEKAEVSVSKKDVKRRKRLERLVEDARVMGRLVADSEDRTAEEEGEDEEKMRWKRRGMTRAH